MPQVIPPAGSDGLPRLSTRVFQLVDQGYPSWAAVWLALGDYLSALLAYFGQEITADIGQIGV